MVFWRKWKRKKKLVHLATGTPVRQYSYDDVQEITIEKQKKKILRVGKLTFQRSEHFLEASVMDKRWSGKLRLCSSRQACMK